MLVKYEKKIIATETWRLILIHRNLSKTRSRNIFARLRRTKKRAQKNRKTWLVSGERSYRCVHPCSPCLIWNVLKKIVLKILIISLFVGNVLEDEDPTTGNSPVLKEATLSPPEEPQNFARPSAPNSASKTGRTPIHILRYLSDMDTPSPNCRQITPMPKTTIVMSPSGCSKTPALANSLGMMSPENVVCQFPAQNEGSPLLPLAGMAGKKSVTPCSGLAAFHLDSPVNDERRRDSVFFAPPSAGVATQENLMCFSPLAEGNNEGTSFEPAVHLFLHSLRAVALDVQGAR